MSDNHVTEESRSLGCFDLLWRLVLAALGVLGGLTLLVMLAALLGVGAVRGWLGSMFNPQPTVLSTPTMVTLVQGQAVLETMRYSFEKVVPVEFAQELGGVGGEKLLYIGVGYITAGVDLSGLSEEAIAVDDAGRVTVTLPPAHLTDCVLDPRSSYVYQHDVGFLNFITDVFNDEPDLLELAEREAIIAFRESALESGILAQAQTYAERHLRAILMAVGAQSVTFQPAEGATPQHDPACYPDQ